MRIIVDPGQVFGATLDAAQAKQLPFAVSHALNRTAVDAQGAMQRHLQAAFTLRREAFILRGIKIERADRSTKTNWRVIIQVAPAVDFLIRAEEGDDHVPAHGKWLWKPNKDVFQGKAIMRNNPLHPANLRFDQHMRGPEGTFMVKTKKSHQLLVLQRTARAGRGVAQSITLGARHQVGRNAAGQFAQGKVIKAPRRGGVRMLYQLVERSRVPAKLEFIRTVTNAVEAAWPWEMQQAMDEALRPRS